MTSMPWFVKHERTSADCDSNHHVKQRRPTNLFSCRLPHRQALSPSPTCLSERHDAYACPLMQHPLRRSSQPGARPSPGLSPPHLQAPALTGPIFCAPLLPICLLTASTETYHTSADAAHRFNTYTAQASRASAIRNRPHNNQRAASGRNFERSQAPGARARAARPDARVQQPEVDMRRTAPLLRVADDGPVLARPCAARSHWTRTRRPK